MSRITLPSVDAYIKELLPARDPVLAEMEALASQNRIPIVGLVVGARRGSGGNRCRDRRRPAVQPDVVGRRAVPDGDSPVARRSRSRFAFTLSGRRELESCGGAPGSVRCSLPPMERGPSAARC